jgi:hypothetical protein
MEKATMNMIAFNFCLLFLFLVWSAAIFANDHILFWEKQTVHVAMRMVHVMLDYSMESPLAPWTSHVTNSWPITLDKHGKQHVIGF